MKTPRRQPAEWETHDAVWIGWPSAAGLWESDLAPARAEVEQFIKAILSSETHAEGLKGEIVRLLARGEEAIISAEKVRDTLPDPSLLTVHEAPIGDIWLRDTGPIFVETEHGERFASAFQFNGWGGKYKLPEDNRIAEEICLLSDTRLRRFDGLVCEGGALETDGEGTFITTRQCLLNKNRNPGMSERDVELVLKEALGAEKVIWLDEGLVGDHTDGHVDNLARFIAPGKVVCMRPNGSDDPNANMLRDIEKALSSASDASGRQIDIVSVPSPGRVLIDDMPAAASHMNFYISNHAVIMPGYGCVTGNDSVAHEALQAVLAEGIRRAGCVVDSAHLLTGGGSFHCISQQQPSNRR